MTSSSQRHGPRHNQISIRLQGLWDGVWQPVDAQQWNDSGFLFFHAQQLLPGAVLFKRSLQHFEGELVWSKALSDEAVVLEMLLNGAIQTQSQKLQAQPETQQRLLNLMRVQGMVEAKHKVLSALGGQLSPDQWQVRVQERLQKPLYQSGVRVDSPAWVAVVKDALSMGEIVQDLERWSGALKKV